MPTQLTRHNRVQTTHEFTLNDGSELALIVRPPTYGEILHERSLMFEGLSSQVRFRLETILIGWKGVVGEDEKPVDWSIENFAALCQLHPDLYIKAAEIVSKYFFTERAAEKNSPAPSAS